MDFLQREWLKRFCKVPHPEIGFYRPSFGKNVQFEVGVHLDCTGDITIGNNVWFNQFSSVWTHSHNAVKPEIKVNNIDIKDNVTIGAYAIITSKCQFIGEGTTVAIGAVVFNETLAPNALYVGNPAKLIKRYKE